MADPAAAKKTARYAASWRLESWELLKNGELDTYPHGEDGQGRLVLSSAGLMSAFYQRPAWKDVDAGVKASWERFIGYGGAWRAEGDTLFFDVIYSSEPSWIGLTFVRHARIEKKKLVYETPEATNRRGDRLVNRLTYRKD
jgi:hypothetical protein